MNFLIVIVLVWNQWTSVAASNGDRSTIYNECIKHCMNINCTRDGEFTQEAALQQDVWNWMTRWSCKDECRYKCMWSTTQWFKEKYDITPKFHGKWPIKRFLGAQEPASAFSSLLNLATNVYMYKKLRTEFSVKTMPIVLFWDMFAIVCIKAWTWSTIFHTRDNDFTEFMDYACAFSLVMALYISAVVRVFHRMRKLTAILLLVPLLFYALHVQYLYSGVIDYGYNMTVNVCFGVIGSLIWLIWSVLRWRSGARYSWRMAVFTCASGALVALEVFDFPPLHDAWDAHALWHLSTAPLPLLFYQFVIDDLRYLSYIKLDSKIT